MKLVHDLQKKALTSTTPLADLLRLAKLVAFKLSLEEDGVWIKSELDGYTSADLLPDYRKVVGKVNYENRVRGGADELLLPNSPRARVLRTAWVADSVTALERLALVPENANTMITFPCDPDFCDEIRSLGNRQVNPFIRVGHGQIEGLLASVRNRVLQWALELEAVGILGDEMAFSNEEVKVAKTHSQQIHIASFTGVLGNVTQSTVTFSDIDQVRTTLKEAGVDEKEIATLEGLLSQSRTETDLQKRSGILSAAGEWLQRNGALIGGFSRVIAGFFGVPTA